MHRLADAKINDESDEKQEDLVNVLLKYKDNGTEIPFTIENVKDVILVSVSSFCFFPFFWYVFLRNLIYLLALYFSKYEIEIQSEEHLFNVLIWLSLFLFTIP